MSNMNIVPGDLFIKVQLKVVFYLYFQTTFTQVPLQECLLFDNAKIMN